MAPETNFPDVVLNENEGEVEVYNLTDYATDANGDNLSFEIIAESNTEIVMCDIANNKLIATTVTDMFGFSNVTIRTTDGELTTEQIIEVKVEQDLTSIEERKMTIAAVAPNPVVNNAVSVSLSKSYVKPIHLNLYNLATGKMVVNETVKAKGKNVMLTTKQVSAGIYYLVLESNDFKLTEKVVWK